MVCGFCVVLLIYTIPPLSEMHIPLVTNVSHVSVAAGWRTVI